jgi:CBS-domain-containing membrane protein
MSEKRMLLKEFYEMKVKDIMLTKKSEILCINEKTEISSIISILNNKDHVWVMDSKEPKQILGIITESDTIPLFSPPVTSLELFEKPDTRSLQFGVTLTAEEIMSKNPIKTFPEETIKDVIIKMKQHKVKHLPVVDQNGILLGDITLHQLIEEFSKVEIKISEKN